MRWCTKRFGCINLPSILMPGTRRGSQELSSPYKLAARGTSSPAGGCASATNALGSRPKQADRMGREPACRIGGAISIVYLEEKGTALCAIDMIQARAQVLRLSTRSRKEARLLPSGACATRRRRPSPPRPSPAARRIARPASPPAAPRRGRGGGGR